MILGNVKTIIYNYKEKKKKERKYKTWCSDLIRRPGADTHITVLVMY